MGKRRSNKHHIRQRHGRSPEGKRDATLRFNPFPGVGDDAGLQPVLQKGEEIPGDSEQRHKREQARERSLLRRLWMDKDLRISKRMARRGQGFR